LVVNCKLRTNSPGSVEYILAAGLSWEFWRVRSPASAQFASARVYQHAPASPGYDPPVLDWRLVGRGRENPQILARDPHGGVLAINRVLGSPDKWWLTGPNYGPGTEHDSQAEAKAAAQQWAETGVRPD
jgi:hypothetical protein